MDDSHTIEQILADEYAHRAAGGRARMIALATNEIALLRTIMEMRSAATRSAKFEMQTFGAVVATILETADVVVEVVEQSGGTYRLTIHNRRPDSDRWDDLSADLRPEHFEMLGSVALRKTKDSQPCI